MSETIGILGDKCPDCFITLKEGFKNNYCPNCKKQYIKIDGELQEVEFYE